MRRFGKRILSRLCERLPGRPAKCWKISKGSRAGPAATPWTLDIVGRQILLEAFGSIGVANATKTIRIYFGATVYIAAQVIAAVTAGDWSGQLLITKTGPNAQIAVGTSDFSGAATVRNVQKLAGAQVDTSPIVVKVTGQSSVATANSATCNLFTISGYN
jgi:hypothetical protein